ncbi:Spy/CpxP family protein refolding chaperone [Pleionea sediminis]|uniref:Spy/CpxP family protein refolding chaperone n=1 Tax=Pleionea sediminis TaxID=2569479 RepID=UPI00118701DA|nr:periplasmic heavy metal sensor [Pleionea sediminis]
MKHFTQLSLSALFLLFTSLSFAGPHHEHHKFEIMKEKLELTDDQVSAIEAIHESQKSSAEPIHKELKTIKKSIHQALNASPIDEESVRSLSLEAAEKKAELMIMKAKSRLLVEEQLTKEQFAKMELLKQKFKQHRFKGNRD